MFDSMYAKNLAQLATLTNLNDCGRFDELVKEIDNGYPQVGNGIPQLSQTIKGC